MIRYDYTCDSCGKDFELKTSYSAYLVAIEISCPHCGSKSTRKVIRPAAVHYADDGFTKHIPSVGDE